MTVHPVAQGNSSARANLKRVEAHEDRNARAIALFRSAEAASAIERQRIHQEIVVEYTDMAEAVARRFSSRSQDWNDIRQVAYLGLVKAADRFTAARGDDFSSFAVPTIVGEIKRHLRDNSWSVRPPRQVQELHSTLLREVPRITQELGRMPTRVEVARELEHSVDAIVEAANCSEAKWPVSLDATVMRDEAVTVADTLVSADGSLEHAELCHALRSACRALSPREKWIVYLRFFCERTQSEIARELGITQMQVSRLLTKILATLRSGLSSDLLAA